MSELESFQKINIPFAIETCVERQNERRMAADRLGLFETNERNHVYSHGNIAELCGVGLIANNMEYTSVKSYVSSTVKSYDDWNYRTKCKSKSTREGYLVGSAGRFRFSIVGTASTAS